MADFDEVGWPRDQICRNKKLVNDITTLLSIYSYPNPACMFNSNSFGALAMDEGQQAQPTAGLSQQLREGEDVDAEVGNLRKARTDV